MIEYINQGNLLLGIVIKANYQCNGVKFFTPNDFSQQLGYMNHPCGHIILPHVHNPVSRQVTYTKEVLLIRSGSIRVDFYDEQQSYIVSYVLYKGDVVMLAYGGHGFEMLEPSEIIEVKQGPYAGDADKTRFMPISSDMILIKEGSN